MKDLWTRLRNDYLGGLQSLLVLALLAGAVSAVAAIWALVAEEPIAVTVAGGALVPPAAATGLRSGVRLDPGGDLHLIIDDPTGQQLAWHTAQSLPWFVLACFAIVMLLVVVTAARRGDPFAAANVRRLRFLGWVLLIGSVAAFYIELWAGLQLSATVLTAAASTGAQLPLVWWCSGFGFLALAEIINRGRALQADLVGVV